MNIDILKKRKKDLGLSNARLAELSGVSLGSINKIFAGSTSNPRVGTLKAIERALGLKRTDGSEVFTYETETDNMVLNDSAVRYKTTYTVKDVEAMPEDHRVELIDGVIYDMSSPTILHQKILGYIHFTIFSYIRSRGGSCEVFLAPLDVQLDRDDFTLVEPDVFIVCDKEKNIRKRICGEPDWVCEIVSPGSKYKDYILKSQKYMNAGVREYWIVDAEAGKITVHSNQGDEYNMEVYSLDTPVPVSIYDDLEIDLSWILDEEM